MKKYLIISICISLLSCSKSFYDQEVSYQGKSFPPGPSSHHDSQMPTEPGKCYAKCIVPNQYDLTERELLEYTGSDFENPLVDLIQFQSSPAISKWVKKKADNNCVSSDPDDCLVWCLEKFPAQIDDIYIVQILFS